MSGYLSDKVSLCVTSVTIPPYTIAVHSDDTLLEQSLVVSWRLELCYINRVFHEKSSPEIKSLTCLCALHVARPS